MTLEAASGFAITQAASITRHVPQDLPALQFFARPALSPVIRLCAVGDIGLSGRVRATASQQGSQALLADVAPLFRAAEITFGNLETVLSDGAMLGQLFSASVTGAATLREAGFEILHLANNHIYDCGPAGLSTTLDAARQAGILPLGAGKDYAAAQNLIRTDVNELRIGWLGCGRTLIAQPGDGPHYWEFNEEELMRAVAAARRAVDVLIVSIHTGLMYVEYPRPDDKRMAERLMEAGADLILMHHAHVLQGVQVTAPGRLCCYNLGNFLFDWTEGRIRTSVALSEQTEGAIFYYELDRSGIRLAAALPTWMDDDCRVHWANSARGDRILRRLARISRDLQATFIEAFERQRAERNTSFIIKLLAIHTKNGDWKCLLALLRRARFEHLKMITRWIVSRCSGFAALV
jgi:poly-gamma-glutamate synthesis protein (capsule biosynthesis protein)